MADKLGIGNIPWTSIAVLAAFVASTQLVPHAFEPLRPAEKARAQVPLDPDLDVNARLWEDPFAAVRRYEAERAERCERVRKQASAPQGVDCLAHVDDVRDPQRLLARLDRDHDQRLDDTLIIMGLMPGADFVGAEEARRRLRYATLAGLMAQDYVPDSAERLSLLQFDLLRGPPPATAAVSSPAAGDAKPAARAGCLTDCYLVPYEMLSVRAEHRRKPDAGGDGRGEKPRRYSQIALLWVDESALPQRKLDALARLTRQLIGAAVISQEALSEATLNGTASRRMPSLAVIGPSSTDALRAALMDLRCAADRKHFARAPASPAASAAAARCSSGVAGDGAAALPDDLADGYRLLSSAEFYNSSSTAPNSMIGELSDQKLDAFVTDQFNRITDANPARPVPMLRTIGNDADLIKRLVNELVLRLPREPRRVVIVAERDSLYAQALVSELRYRLRDSRSAEQLQRIEVIYFFRGLDGVTTRDASAAAAPGAGSKNAPLEWPESRDQLDYLRRMGADLKRSETDPNRLPIGAIGIFANDVHDKLLVLQAMHEDFSDRMFFTTDMDARYLHPRTQAFTRNLVVASSLPLAFYPPAPGASAVDLQAGTPPFRDIYQVSTYAAARRTGCRSESCKREERLALEPVLQKPSMYEIGRSSAVPLSGYALEAGPPRPDAGRTALAALMVVVMGVVLLVWPSTPSMRQARQAFLREPTAVNQPHMDMTSIVLVALHAGLFAYVLASLIEFLRPSQLGFVQALLLASLAAFGALLAVLPALLQARRELPAPPDQPARVDRLHLIVVLFVVALWVWLAWPVGGWRAAVLCESCEPVTWVEGVSAWPSHLIHLLALFAILWALDWAWADTVEQLRRDADWLRLPRAMPAPMVRNDLRLLVGGWFEHVSVLFWRSGVGYSCDFQQLWKEYGERGEARPRAARTLVWFALTVCCAALLFMCLSEGQIPAVPVRGDEHRQMVTVTLYAILLLLPLLIVAVADATVLLLRFVRHLNAGRSFYPEATVEMFAKGLGEEHKALWSQRFCGRPEERGRDGGGFAVHTLLDDWIDVQVVARRSATVARLVIGPFVVLALLVVARSRLFDNWALTTAVAVGVSCYVLALIGLTLLLKQSAEATRRRALESMQADLRWLAGSGKPLSDLVEPFKRLIAQVENNQQGAFAPFFDQPLLKAMLVPLGGAGGTQLFDYLLLGR
ncbi:hypothetical protein [Roseateles sp. BYS96W]|uniref:Uncharacterized protein n=1 Tax=Pelomonas nitida TaxID=3299027 RepID=A0ABW7G2F9_9BURK